METLDTSHANTIVVPLRDYGELKIVLDTNTFYDVYFRHAEKRESLYGPIEVTPSTTIAEFKWSFLKANGEVTQSNEHALFIDMIRRNEYEKDFSSMRWYATSEIRQPYHASELVQQVLRSLLETDKLSGHFSVTESTPIFLIADGKPNAEFWRTKFGFAQHEVIYDKHGIPLPVMRSTVTDVLGHLSRQLPQRIQALEETVILTRDTTQFQDFYLKEYNEWCYGSIIVEQPSKHIEQFVWHYLKENGELTNSSQPALFISTVRKKGYTKTSKDVLAWSAKSNPNPRYVSRLIRKILEILVTREDPFPFHISKQTHIFLIADGEDTARYWRNEHGFETRATVMDKHDYKLPLMSAVVERVMTPPNPHPVALA